MVLHNVGPVLTSSGCASSGQLLIVRLLRRSRCVALMVLVSSRWRLPNRTREDKHMKKVMTAAFALSALFAASGKTPAEVNYPWCIMGDTRGFECVFSSREQCPG
jgi:Protein of unknown function (DUF3551)